MQKRKEMSGTLQVENNTKAVTVIVKEGIWQGSNSNSQIMRVSNYNGAGSHIKKVHLNYFGVERRRRR